MNLLCAVIGHKWQVVEDANEVEPVLCCDRCGRRQLVANATGFGIRTKTKADAYGSYLKK